MVRASVCTALCLTGLTRAQELDGAGSEPADVRGDHALAGRTLVVQPPEVQLDDGRDRQRIVVFGRLGEDDLEEVTDAAAWRVQPPELAVVDQAGDSVVVRPLHDGDGEISVSVGPLTLRVPLRVRSVAARPDVSFANEVLPILTKSGCNAGSCHGAASGKNGFGLSLFGFDPAHDHRALTRELRGRRLDVADPDESLFLKKGSARVTHQGGKRLDREGAPYAELRAWVASGADDDVARAPRLLGIDVLPGAAVVRRDQRLTFLLRARYADGSDRDVTDLALWSSSNESTLAVGATGRSRAQDAGEAYVLARYGGFAVIAQVQVHVDATPFVWSGPEPVNFVDELVFAKLRRAHVQPAPRCSDSIFLRRVHLDLVGVLPTPDEAEAFLTDGDPGKRAKLVERLLARPEFSATQAMAWADVLQVDAGTMEPKGAALMTRYLQEAFAEKRPFDAVVNEILTAEGPTFSTPAANFYAATNQPNLVAERVAQVFLGVRVQCAQCHNHPFESWTMDDYYGFAAFFGQLGRKRAEDPTEWVVYDRRNGEVRHRVDNRVVPPKLLGGDAPQIPRGTDRRAVLARWLTAADNPWFAKNIANRSWARLFGRGIVEPSDDVRVSNPASHPELLQRLAGALIEAHFDVRPLYRLICASLTYQAGAPTAPPAPAALFAGNQVRRLEAEQLLDAIGAVTGVPTRYPGLPLGAAASAIAGGGTGVRFLEVFGRPERGSACTCERSTEPTLRQTLHLVNGDTIAAKLVAKRGRLQRALADSTPPEAMLRDLFLAAYCRPPTPNEVDDLLARVRAADDPTRAWQDLYWAVLNSREFLFQH
ncbi:MAG: DUF1549 and DUF1553 domain-containing protein [Planctomycetota bacterium]